MLVDFKGILIGKDRVDGKLTGVNKFRINFYVEHYNVGLDRSCCWVDDQLDELLRASSISQSWHAQLGNLEQFFRAYVSPHSIHYE